MKTFYLKRGNAKLNKDTTLVWNLPAGATCGMTCPGCYAIKSQKMWPSVAKAWNKNLSLAEDASEFVSVIDDELKHFQTTKTPPKFVRVHGSGDFFNQNYINAWAYIAERNKDYTFYAYTVRLGDFDFSPLFELQNFVLHDSTISGGKLNYGPMPAIQELADEVGGFVCPYSKDRTGACGGTCIWCMEKKNEGTPILFEAH